MTKLIPILVFSLIMVGISSIKSKYELDNMGGKVYVYKERFFNLVTALGMAVFVGLRTRGNDTFAYRHMYDMLQVNGSVFDGITWNKLASAPGLQLLQNILKSFGCTAQDYFMVCALITIIIYLWFIRKYTSDIWLSVYYFITMGVYTLTMAAIKQTICVAFLLIAVDRAIDKKWARFVAWVVIAELFHPFALIYLVIPFLFFSPWTKRTAFFLGGTVIVALLLDYLLDDILYLTDSLGAGYTEASLTGDGVSIFRVLVVSVPMLISFFMRQYLKQSDDRVVNLVINASMVNACIMFIGLFGTANYFARLANYFLIFQTLALPWLFRAFKGQSKQIVVLLSIVLYFCYLYYGSVLANGAFDDVYDFMSLWKYLTHNY